MPQQPFSNNITNFKLFILFSSAKKNELSVDDITEFNLLLEKKRGQNIT